MDLKDADIICGLTDKTKTLLNSSYTLCLKHFYFVDKFYYEPHHKAVIVYYQRRKKMLEFSASVLP